METPKHIVIINDSGHQLTIHNEKGMCRLHPITTTIQNNFIHIPQPTQTSYIALQAPGTPILPTTCKITPSLEAIRIYVEKSEKKMRVSRRGTRKVIIKRLKLTCDPEHH